MILTKTVVYRGKPKLVSELNGTSRYRVDVRCPICNEVRNVLHNSIFRAGHCICHSCILAIKKRKIEPPGAIFNRLTVLQPHDDAGYCYCKCDCGNMVVTKYTYIRNGDVKSCGCLKKDNFNGTRKVSGEEHGMWNGGISPERGRDMVSSRYKEWRSSVFQRDNYTCQKCNIRGYSLNAHHIHDYKHHLELRYDSENGVTLCTQCHTEFHNQYGRKNTIDQLREFMGTTQR